jgi:hypothetical protein
MYKMRKPASASKNVVRIYLRVMRNGPGNGAVRLDFKSKLI